IPARYSTVHLRPLPLSRSWSRTQPRNAPIIRGAFSKGVPALRSLSTCWNTPAATSVRSGPLSVEPVHDDVRLTSVGAVLARTSTTPVATSQILDADGQAGRFGITRGGFAGPSLRGHAQES